MSSLEQTQLKILSPNDKIASLKVEKSKRARAEVQGKLNESLSRKKNVQMQINEETKLDELERYPFFIIQRCK